MDELTLLRRLDADTEAPSKAVLGDAFDALDARMIEAEHGGRRHVAPRRRRRLRRMGVSALVVGALAAALVMTDTIGVAGLRPGASAEAAEVLDHAATIAIGSEDPVVGAGQLLAVRTTSVSMSSSGTGDSALRWLREGTDTLYIPHDRGSEWTLVRSIQRPVAFFSPAAKAEAMEAYASAEQRYDGRDELLRGRAGDFYGTPADEVGFADLPRDPRVLLNRIYRTTLGQGRSPDGEALEWIAGQLRTGAVPADLRAAMFQAAALIPGVAVVDDQTVLDGRTGTAIGRVEPSTGVRQDVVIDPASGLLIGERRVATRAVDGIPAGTTIGSTAVTTSVVDSAPSGPEHRVQ